MAQEFAQYWAEQRELKPSPILEMLADAVFAQSTKRSPIWKFQLAPDLILSVQPKVGVGYPPGMPRIKENLAAIRWFDCRAAEGESVDASTLLKKQPEHRRLKFRITAEWLLKRSGIWRKRGDPRGVTGPFVAMQDRIETAFAVGFFDHLQPERMLGRACLMCGKGLTDPVSMARLIGPSVLGRHRPIFPGYIVGSSRQPSERRGWSKIWLGTA